MNRRKFLKNTAIASLGAGMLSWKPFLSAKTHIITLSFDDGFRKSYLEIADIYEKYGFKACFNVIASAHLPEFKAPDDYILPELMGSFEDWNALVARGHEVMPHGWRHAWLNRLPLEEAKQLIAKSIDYFTNHLEAFDPRDAVFNYPFNASTPELEAFTLTKIAALRTRGGALNPLPTKDTQILTCSSYGPKNIDGWVKQEVDKFLEGQGGWLILNTHGLKKEGWGPMRPKFLNNLLKRLVSIDHVAVQPAAAVLRAARAKEGN